MSDSAYEDVGANDKASVFAHSLFGVYVFYFGWYEEVAYPISWCVTAVGVA